MELATCQSVGNSPGFPYRDKFGNIVSGSYTWFDAEGHQRMYSDARPFRYKDDPLNIAASAAIDVYLMPVTTSGVVRVDV